MPTRLKKKGGQWQARVYANGKQVASRLFPAGRKGGPEWRAARAWEEEQKASVKAGAKIDSDLQLLSDWLRLYVGHTRRTMSPKTADEKAAFLADFADYCLGCGIKTPYRITPQVAYEFLTSIFDRRGGHVANKYRKHLLAAWHWGIDTVDNFPDRVAPFQKVKTFKVVTQDRYVPPDDDVAAVLAQAKGQDAVMLLAYIQTGARKGELFRLTWNDVDLENKRVKLIDRKGGDGAYRERWRGINDDLVESLNWWQKARPVDMPNVFMQLADHRQDVKVGDPFKCRKHLMARLCKQAGVKPFGLHALRHKGAAIVFTAEGLNEAQLFLGHAKATTTDRYVKSAGLYTGSDTIVNVIMNSSVGQAAAEQVRKTIAPEVAASEANL